MFDTVFYAQLVRQSRLPHDFIAHMLNLSEKEYLKRATGIKPFNSDDIAILKNLFCLSGTEAERLFFCNNFKIYCQDKHITNKDLADLLGVTPATVSRKINGKSPFYVSEVVKICREYNISADDYF